MAQVEKRPASVPATFEWEYAPAPEARDIVQIRERYGLFVGGEEVEPRTSEWFASISPSTEEPLFEVALAGEEDVALAVDAARGAFENGWSSLAPSERAKYLFRLARLIQERSRELAVAESLDGGKPIRESRDVDIPLAAAHFFYYAGWADKLEYAFPNRTPRPLGVAAQIIPWNFPLLMLAWKIAPALACGNTVVLKPAETTPLTAMIFADICRQAELPPGVVNLVTGDGTTGAHLVRNEGIDKLAFTGSTEVGKLIMRELAGRDVRLTLELGGKAANIVFDDAALDQAVEGIVNGIYFNQGHVCCAGSRLLVQESIYEPLLEKLKRRLSTLRVGDPLDKNTDVGAINSKAQLEKIRELVASGEEEGAEIYQPACRPARARLLVRADALHERRAELPDRAGGDLRAGAVRADVPDARGGGREGEQHAVRALGRRVDGEGLADPVDGRAAARRRRVGEHVQPLRPDVAVRRLPGVRLRPRGRPPRTRAVPEVRGMTHCPLPTLGGELATLHPASSLTRRTSSTSRRSAPIVHTLRVGRTDDRLSVKKTYKLYVGGAFPRSESGRTFEAEGTTSPARHARTRATPCARARSAPGLVGHDGLQPRPGALPARGDDGGSRVRPRERVHGPRARSRRRSIAPSGTRAGPTSSRRCSAARIRSPGRTSTSRFRSRPASSRSSRRRSRRSSGSSRASLPALVGGNTVVVVAGGGSIRSLRSSSPRRSRPRTSRRARSTSSRGSPTSSRRGSPGTWT